MASLTESVGRVEVIMKPTAVDLFCGAGGLTQGLRQAGFNVVGALEIDKDAADVFRLNHPKTKLIEKDITEVSVDEAIKYWGIEKGKLDLLAGCPPCQGFSTIGTRNRKAATDDPRNELIFQMLRFIEEILPKTIMLENVPALAKDARLQKFCNRLTDLGYDYDYKVLDVQRFNVPQRRKRMILLASRERNVVVHDVDLTEDSPKTVRMTFKKLESSFLSNDSLSALHAQHSEHVMNIIRAIPHDGGSRCDLPDNLVLKCHKRVSGFRDVYGRMSWDLPSPTITCGCNNPSKGRFIHPEEDRAISLREAASLQTFPFSYKFPALKGSQKISRMIGNALPPKFIEFHARCIKGILSVRSLDENNER